MNNLGNSGKRYVTVDFVASGTNQYYFSGIVIPAGAVLSNILYKVKTAFTGSNSVKIFYKGSVNNTAPVYADIAYLTDVLNMTTKAVSESIPFAGGRTAKTIIGEGEICFETDNTALSGSCIFYIEFCV
jgi:hypothetical protein